MRISEYRRASYSELVGFLAYRIASAVLVTVAATLTALAVIKTAFPSAEIQRVADRALNSKLYVMGAAIPGKPGFVMQVSLKDRKSKGVPPLMIAGK